MSKFEGFDPDKILEAKVLPEAEIKTKVTNETYVAEAKKEISTHKRKNNSEPKKIVKTISIQLTKQKYEILREAAIRQEDEQGGRITVTSYINEILNNYIKKESK